MKTAIKLFVDNYVSEGQYFDSNAVVAYLIQHHTSLFLQGAGGKITVDTYHGTIAQITDRLVDDNKKDMVKRIGITVSKNIRDRFSECHLWMKY